VLIKFQKFQNIRFVGNLILSARYELYVDDVTVTSFIHIRCGSVSCNEQRSGICFRRARGRSANAIQSEMRPVSGGKFLQDQQYMFDVKVCSCS